MYVCLCHGVTDHKIRELVDGGACSVAEIMRCSKAGTRCGSCRPTIANVVEGHLHGRSESRHLPVLAPLASSG